MARIIFGSYVMRFPMGGYVSYVLHWLAGFTRLGHDVYFVEKACWQNACFDPVKKTMSDDCSAGMRIFAAALKRLNLADKWCFVDIYGNHFGMSREEIDSVFQSADLFIDMGTHGAWLDEAQYTKMRVLLDDEPAWTQMRMEQKRSETGKLIGYDRYVTVGQNIGTDWCDVPTAGFKWLHTYHPVNADWFEPADPEPDDPFTTVMSWQAHESLRFGGKEYCQKDVEFMKIATLPSRTKVPLEVAVHGQKIPCEALIKQGWRVRDGQKVTKTLKSYNDYIKQSRGEFSVCKNVFVATNSGWFSDRSAAYLAMGRPVIVQETGFSRVLPCGNGLLSFSTIEEAKTALESVISDYQRHSKAARDIAMEYLHAPAVVTRLLRKLEVV